MQTITGTGPREDFDRRLHGKMIRMAAAPSIRAIRAPGYAAKGCTGGDRLVMKQTKEDPAMTRLQLRNLQVYLKYRERPMTISGLFWANRRIYLLLLMLFGVATGLFYIAGGWRMASYALVAEFCILLRDVGYFRRSARMWPVMKEVLDWQKVERLVSTDSVEKK